MKKFVLYFLFSIILFSCNNKQLKTEVVVTKTPSWELAGFVKADDVNPIMNPSDSLSFYCPLTKKELFWEERNVLNPSAIVKDDKVYLFYRAQDAKGTSRIGLAISEDGLHFKKNATPVFYPDNDDMYQYEWNFMKRNGEALDLDCKSCYFDGLEDPRIIEREDGTYVMTYTAYDGKMARLALATSKDLINWTKHGLVIKGESMKNNWFLIICVKKNKYFKHIGNISVRFYKEDESASISILIGSSKFRNIGLGKAIWQCMMRRLSTINEIKLIKAGTFYKNSPMIKIFKQNNMKLSKKKLFINARKNINR